MGRTFIRQDAQIKNSILYSDAIAPGSTMESAAVSIEDDLNAIRSQLKSFGGDSRWYTALSGRSLGGLSSDLSDLENKKLLVRSQILTAVAVPASQNHVVLSVAGAQTPTLTASVGAVATNGAVVAVATAINAHGLSAVSGLNALNPKNLVIVRNSATGDDILSSGKRIYALIQSEGSVDGHTFADSVTRVQLSFVRENSAGTALEACPVADIASKSINYSYVARINLDAIPEQSFLGGAFVDATASVDVTLDNAIDNQGGPVTQQQNVDWRIDDGFSLDFQTSDGTRNLVSVAPTSGGDSVVFNVDAIDINVGMAGTVDIDNGITVASSGTAISLGIIDGGIASAGALTLASQALGDLTLMSAQEIVFSDLNKTGSGFSSSLKLSETTAEWQGYETRFGEVSLLNAIVQAGAAGGAAVRTRHVAMMTSDAGVNDNVTGSGGAANLDGTLGDFSAVSFVGAVNVFLNGVLLRNGADAAANHDVYPGDSASDGALKFEFAVRTGDVLTMEIFA